MRLAREYEAAEGRDLRGFLDFLAERAGRDREGQAATEAEDHDGVRVMTVHAAKGLEFPVVAVADLGRELLAGGRQPPVQVADAHDSGDGEGDGPPPPRVGIRLARFGTTAIGVFGYGEMLDAAAEDEAAEACRLAYVAATRARRLLILSGRYSAKRLARPAGDGPKPGIPITERLMRSLGIGDGEDTEIGLPAPQPRPGLQAEFPAGRIAVRFNRPDPAAFAALQPRVERGEEVAPPTLSAPAPRSSDGDRRARSGTPLLLRAGDLRALRLPVLRGAGAGFAGTARMPWEDGDREPAGRFGFGNAVHAMLEWSARHGWRSPTRALCRDCCAGSAWRRPADELDRGRGMVAAGSPRSSARSSARRCAPAPRDAVHPAAGRLGGPRHDRPLRRRGGDAAGGRLQDRLARGPKRWTSWSIATGSSAGSMRSRGAARAQRVRPSTCSSSGPASPSRWSSTRSHWPPRAASSRS